MALMFICDRAGIVEYEIFAAAYRAHGLASLRHLEVQVMGEVKPFDNGAGYTPEVLQSTKALTMR